MKNDFKIHFDTLVMFRIDFGLQKYILNVFWTIFGDFFKKNSVNQGGLDLGVDRPPPPGGRGRLSWLQPGGEGGIYRSVVMFITKLSESSLLLQFYGRTPHVIIDIY